MRKTTPSVVLKKPPFDDRNSLVDLLKGEPCFRIQVFSLESIEVFEDFLHSKKIAFTRGFTSGRESATGDASTGRGTSPVMLLLDDGPPASTLVLAAPRVLLYSNMSNPSFIPYQFMLSLNEKQAILRDRRVPSERRALAEARHSGALTAALAEPLDLAAATAGALNYVQSVIVLCLVREGRFKRLCKEVQQVEPGIDSMMWVRAELNWLCKHKFCLKSGNIFKLNISHEAVVKVSERLGFRL